MKKGQLVDFHFRNYQHTMLCQTVSRVGEFVLLEDGRPHAVVEAVLYQASEDEKSLVPHVLLREATAAEKKIVAKFDNIR